MVTRDDLVFLRDSKQREEELTDQMELLRQRINDPIPEMIRSREFCERIEELNAGMEETGRRLADTLEQDRIRKQRILEEIASLPQDEAKLLRMRYLDKRSWQRIARDLCYSLSSVFNIHRRALQRLGIDSVPD